MRGVIAIVALVCLVQLAQSTPTCSVYCGLMNTNCAGANLQYADLNTCMTACEAIPPTGDESDAASVDNNLGCRQYHAGAASSDPALHCPHAGPYGGGVCGSTCQSYCNFFTGTGKCASNLPIFASQSECEATFCDKYPAAASGMTWLNPNNYVTGNSKECRAYHAYVAQVTNSTDHCRHATPLSVIGQCTTATSGDAAADVYCENNIRACGVSGVNMTTGQYASLAQCKAVAVSFTRRPDAQNAQWGNSIDCRNYHSLVAGVSPALQAVHCEHSGLNGKQFCSGAGLDAATGAGTDCMSFCTANLGICTGTLAQYGDINSCMAMCMTMTVASEKPYPVSGGSLQCRFYHLQVASANLVTNDRSTHCPHTGPTGGEGVCGTAADFFCDLDLAACGMTGGRGQYSSRAQCLATVPAYPRDASGTLAAPVTTGNSAECRAYHAGVSLQLPDAHCNHTGIFGGNSAALCGTACAGFCSVVQTGCATTARQQFASVSECLSYCASFPTTGMQFGAEFFLNTAGNSLECRAYHASVAIAGDNAAKDLHCPHAGAVSASNTCGTACDAYCNTIQAACGSTGANMQFATTAACLSSCATYGIGGTKGDSTGNTLQCRQYHAGVALTGDAGAKTTHCPHAGATPTAFCVAQSMSSTGTLTGTGAASTVSASLALVSAAIAVALAAIKA